MELGGILLGMPGWISLFLPRPLLWKWHFHWERVLILLWKSYLADQLCDWPSLVGTMINFHHASAFWPQIRLFRSITRIASLLMRSQTFRKRNEKGDGVTVPMALNLLTLMPGRAIRSIRVDRVSLRQNGCCSWGWKSPERSHMENTSLRRKPPGGKICCKLKTLSSVKSKRADCLVNISLRTLAVEFGCLHSADN